MREFTPMAIPRKVLVVDHNPDSRFLLTKTLLRKFPHVMVLECAEAASATGTAAEGDIDVIVVHRTAGVIGVDLIRMLREVSGTVPIIMVSGIDRSTEAIAAGANFFLSYDEWLRIGTVVAELLSLPASVVDEGPVTVSPLDARVASMLRHPRAPPPNRRGHEPDGPLSPARTGGDGGRGGATRESAGARRIKCRIFCRGVVSYTE